VLNRHVQLCRVQVDDHSCDFGGMLLADHLMDVLVDGCTDNLFSGISRCLGELLRVKHRKDLRLVDLELVYDNLLLFELHLSHLMSLHLLRIARILLHLVAAVCHLRLSLCLRQRLARRLTALLHPTLLLMAVVVGARPTWLGIVDLMANDPV